MIRKTRNVLSTAAELRFEPWRATHASAPVSPLSSVSNSCGGFRHANHVPPTRRRELFEKMPNDRCAELVGFAGGVELIGDEVVGNGVMAAGGCGRF